MYVISAAKLKVGQIVGIVLGVIIPVALILAALFYYLCKKWGEEKWRTGRRIEFQSQ